MAQSAYIEEVPLDTPSPDQPHDSSEDEAEDLAVEDALTSVASSSNSKKKKKKKSKAAKALSAFQMKASVSQPLVDEVLKRVQAEVGPSHPEANEASVREALQQLQVTDFLKGKTGLGGKNKKDMGGYKFWSTQPVSKIGESPPQADGYIEPAVSRNEVRQEPFPLPNDFEWVTVDICNRTELTELFELLSANYVEDDDAAFRFKYSAEFLEWALKPPGWHKEWHVGVRVKSNKKLVAFIAGAPVTLRVRNAQFKSVEINFLVVHKKLRGKRMAPVLIKEVTRQCHLKGIFQAIYTAGVFLPTPVSTCRYYHRLLNVPKLVDVKFTGVKAGMTVARMVRLFKLPSAPALAPRGFREMEERDVPEVRAIYNQYMKRFGMVPVFSQDELRHLLISGRGTGDIVNGRREGQVVWSYVVEDSTSHKVTDFASFYCLPSTVLGHQRHNLLDAAYLFYYGTNVAFQSGAEQDGRLKARLDELIQDLVIVAEKARFDVFNAMTLMDNDMFLTDLKFGQGDGLLNFYLYNWRTAPLAGVEPSGEYERGRGVGIVML